MTAAVTKRRPYRRAQIVEAAAHLFEQRGLAGTGIDAIGLAVGISGPAIYRHFASKDDVLAAVLDDGAQLVRAVRDRVRNEAPGREMLDWLVDHYIVALRERPALTGLMLGGRLIRDPATDMRLRRYFRDHVKAWSTSLGVAVPSYSAQERDLRVHMALNVGRLFQVYPHIAELDVSGEMTRRIIDGYLFGG